MAFEIKYINVFNDINSIYFDDIKSFYNQADLKIIGQFNKPSFEDVTKIQQTLKGFRGLTTDNIISHLTTYSGVDRPIVEFLAPNMINEFKMQVTGENAVISFYMKVAYWFKELFKPVINDRTSKIFVDTDNLKMHELYMLYLLSKLGNEIVIVDRHLNKDIYKLYNNINWNISDTNDNLDIYECKYSFEDVLNILSGSDERIQNEGSISVITGMDQEGKLNNLLVSVGNSTPPNMFIFKDGVKQPTFEDTQSIRRPQVSSKEELLRYINNNTFNHSNSDNTDKIVKFTKKQLECEHSLGKCISKLITIIAIYNKLDLTKQIYIIYGDVNKITLLCSDILKCLDKTVIIIDPRASYTDSSLNVITAGDSINNTNYPVNNTIGTIAYQASQEISKTLYNGETQGLFRDRQYKTCNTVNMVTTIDELLIYWDKEVTVRPGFRNTPEAVDVPVIYSVINGCSDDYKQLYSDLATEHTLVYYNFEEMRDDFIDTMFFNHMCSVKDTDFKSQKPLVKNGRLLKDEIINCRNFSYKHLNLDVQAHIIDKIDQILANKLIEHPGMTDEKYIDTLLNIGFNLGIKIQNELQWHDYTKENPKLVLLCQNVQQLNIEQSIVITLLHLCGWDVVILIPTGYNILGEYLKREDMQSHMYGSPRFDLSYDKFNPIETMSKTKKKGIFSKLFNK